MNHFDIIPQSLQKIIKPYSSKLETLEIKLLTNIGLNKHFESQVKSLEGDYKLEKYNTF